MCLLIIINRIFIDFPQVEQKHDHLNCYHQEPEALMWQPHRCCLWLAVHSCMRLCVSYIVVTTSSQRIRVNKYYLILWHPSGPAMSNVMPCHCLLFSIPIISLFCCRPKSSATDTAHAVHNAVARVIARMLTLRSLTTHSRCGTSSVGTPRVIAQHSASQLFGRRCRLRFVLLFFFDRSCSKLPKFKFHSSSSLLSPSCVDHNKR